MASFNPTLSCNVCGCAAVCVDEVFRPERLILSECGRCRHRWTQAPQASSPVRSLRPARRAEPAEVALAS